MKSIQEIAFDAFEMLKRYKCGDETIQSEPGYKLFTQLISQTSTEVRVDFLDSSLDTIYKIPDHHSCPADMQHCSDWEVPYLTECTPMDLWFWFVSDMTNLDYVDTEISQKFAEGEKPDLVACIQNAVWREQREVFEAVKAYLVEAYNAQPDDEEDEDEDGNDEE